MQEINSYTKIKSQLLSSMKSGRVVHAFLFSGGSHSERLNFGKWFAKALLCQSDNPPCNECLSCRKFDHSNHEDFILIEKPDDKESIVKDQILGLIDRLSYTPFGDKYVVIIDEAQLMNAASQNKLLKTLEEPVSEVVIILLAERADMLLDTIKSRCSIYFLSEAVTSTDEQLKQIAAEYQALIFKNAPYYQKKAALKPILDNKDDARDKAIAFLGILEDNLRDMLVITDNPSSESIKTVSAWVGQIEKSRSYLNQLHNVAYTLKQMSLL